MSSIFAFFSSSHNQTQGLQTTTQPVTQITVSPKQNSEITKDTIIAKSFAAPVLYPDAEWVDVTALKSSKKDNINKVEVFAKNNNNFAIIDFPKGHYWKTKKLGGRYPLK